MSQTRTGTPVGRFREVIDSILKEDPVVMALVGQDSRGHRKVYEIGWVPQDAQPNYITYALLDVERPEGHYHDLKAMEMIPFQVAGWAETRDEAWQLFEEAEHAIDKVDFAPLILPWEIMIIRREGVGGIPDETTGWWQVRAQYRAALGR